MLSVDAHICELEALRAPIQLPLGAEERPLPRELARSTTTCWPCSREGLAGDEQGGPRARAGVKRSRGRLCPAPALRASRGPRGPQSCPGARRGEVALRTHTRRGPLACRHCAGRACTAPTRVQWLTAWFRHEPSCSKATHTQLLGCCYLDR